MLFSFRTGSVLLAICLIRLVPGANAQTPGANSPNIRIDVDRVNVGVTVTDSRGQFVSGLHREDFHLFDNGVEQPITDFLSTDEPAQVLLLIEAGPAVYLLQGGHLYAVQSLLQGLAPNDRVAIARYNEAAEGILDFTPDKFAAFAALDRLRFNLGFAQLNLASSLSTALDWLTRIPGKKSIVLLSTGVDTSSADALNTLLARLKTSDVRVLAVSLGAELRGAKPTEKQRKKKGSQSSARLQAASEGFAAADRELQAIADASGNHVYFPRSERDFAEVYSEIAQLVRHEYSIAFIPPARDGAIHSINVTLADSADSSSKTSANTPSTSALNVGHRMAYVAPSGQ